METISLKMDGRLLKEIDSKLEENRYSTRTEFIRDSIRDKLSELDKQKALQHLHKIAGFSKRKTTDEELHQAREKAFLELEKKFKNQ
ncbi:MAG: ribbon-helix-helix domain-containing protein [Nanoarchaeota archaeon]